MPNPVSTYAAVIRWQEIALPVPSAGASASLADVAAGGPGFVAVGEEVWSGGSVAVAWTSTDGLAWKEHAVERYPGLVGGLSAVASGDGILVATQGLQRYRSTDGVTWEKVPASGWVIADLAWGPAGFVAAGYSQQGDGQIATSPDGRTWHEVSDSVVLQGFCPEGVAGGPLGYVVIGETCTEDQGPLLTDRLVIVTSSDGRNWARARSQASLAGDVRAYSGILSGGRDWIAYSRFRPDGEANWGVQVWNSVDGLAWRRATFLRPAPPYVPASAGPADMTDMAPFGPGYVAVGGEPGAPSSWGAAWGSPDGHAWRSLQYSASQTRFPPGAMALASDGRQLVAVGRRSDYQPLILVGSLAVSP